MFLNLEKKPSQSLAMLDSLGNTLTYGELIAFIAEFKEVELVRAVTFALCENKVEALAGSLALTEHGLVPLLLGAETDPALLDALLQEYQPTYLWLPIAMRTRFANCTVMLKKKEYCLLKTEYEPYPVLPELALLLTTSGSTGSPKLVRYTKNNLEANAKNVAAVFAWPETERGIIDLPMQYTMGLNVINSHLYAGATVLLTHFNIMDAQFWTFIKENKGTNFTGVPFSYELMLRLRFTKMDLPDLSTFAQGGGRLTDETFQQLATYAKETNRRFIATFGTTETSARMAFLPSELALDKCGSIGRAIPEGELFLLNDAGAEIPLTEDEATGELGYRGPNVTLGYAQTRQDLARPDDWHGEYHTGDIARRDKDGCYYIIGRKGRFLKLTGHRIGLDECERLIKTEFHVECACTGTDKRLLVYLTEEALTKEVTAFLSERLKLYKSLFEVRVIEALPKNEAGKIMYKLLPME